MPSQSFAISKIAISKIAQASPRTLLAYHNCSPHATGFEWHVLHIHSVLLMLFRAVMHKSRISFEHDLHKEALQLVTDDIYHSWSQQLQMYSGPTLMF
jgi:hypothetical protein